MRAPVPNEIMSDSDIERADNDASSGWYLSASTTLRLVATLYNERRRRDAADRSASKDSAELRTIIVRREVERDAALALLRRIVVSTRLGSIDEAAVREAGRLVGEDGKGK